MITLTEFETFKELNKKNIRDLENSMALMKSDVNMMLEDNNEKISQLMYESKILSDKYQNLENKFELSKRNNDSLDEKKDDKDLDGLLNQEKLKFEEKLASFEKRLKDIHDDIKK